MLAKRMSPYLYGHLSKNTTRLREAQDKDIEYLGCQVTLDKEEA